MSFLGWDAFRIVPGVRRVFVKVLDKRYIVLTTFYDNVIGAVMLGAERISTGHVRPQIENDNVFVVIERVLNRELPCSPDKVTSGLTSKQAPDTTVFLWKMCLVVNANILCLDNRFLLQ